MVFALVNPVTRWHARVFAVNRRRVQMMQDTDNPAVATLENQITERYGLLLSHTQLAKLLGHTPGGLRYSLSYPSDQQTYALKICGCKIGRRVYYPAAEVARIIIGAGQA